jgi:hypothetical protein
METDNVAALREMVRWPIGLLTALPRARDLNAGEAAAEVALQGVASSGSAAPLRSSAGFPVFSSGKRITSEDVHALLCEDIERK